MSVGDFFKNIGDNIATVVTNVTNTVERNAPTICLAAGIIGIGGALFATYKATLKLPEVIKETEDEVNDIKEAQEHVIAIDEKGELIDTDANNSDIAKCYIKGGFNVAKLYAPAAILSAASIALILHSHTEMLARNAAIAAYAIGVQKEFDDYRENIRLLYGDDIDKRARFGIVVQEKIADEETGDVHNECTLVMADPLKCKTRFLFDETTSEYWTKNVTYNMDVLSLIENDLNTTLERRGKMDKNAVLFMNEALDMLETLVD